MQFIDRCNLKLRKVDNPFPEFPVPEGQTLDSYFEQVCREGLEEAPRDHRRPPARPRAADARPSPTTKRAWTASSTCIKQMKFPGYFMIVWDFIRYASEQESPSARAVAPPPDRSSPTCMEITDIDPLQNELLFERFLNPERVSMPDIDIDFCMNRRGEVIEYVKRKYGNDQVAQIITFNTMAAKAAIKDVGRALDMPYGEVDRIAKMIPTTIGITIDQALKEGPDSRNGLRQRPEGQGAHRHGDAPRRARARSRRTRRRRRHRAASRSLNLSPSPAPRTTTSSPPTT